MTASDTEPIVVLCCNDLMMTSGVGHAASQRGAVFRMVSDPAALPTAVPADGRCLLLLDLSVAGLNLSDMTQHLSPDALREGVAYGPHVHRERMAAAAAAGFGTVMSRGEFSVRYGQVISDWMQSHQSGRSCGD